jgi:hypothetical protein
MSVPKPSTRSRRPKIPAPRDAYADARALLVIDHARLQGAAWAEFHTAQKRHQKVARDLHRHEEIDTPAYEAWLHRTFPVLMTTLRNLQEEVSTKGRQVQLTRALATYTGRSAKKLWQEQKENKGRPPQRPEEADDVEDDARKARQHRRDPDDDFFRDDDAFGRRSRRRDRDDYEPPRPPPAPPRSSDARDLYRRLVQHLHPDRGGEWTAARKRLWHEVQQAWALGDADWLARLEIEWETANEVLGPTSPLSRLRRAIEELHAARRDTERKLRSYRVQPAWRFTLLAKKRDFLHERTEKQLLADLHYLRRDLAYLDKTIAAWEEPVLGRSKPRYTTPRW